MVTMNRNKVVIVGTGQVGATAAFSIVTHGLCNELVLIDHFAAKALGEARDLDDGSEFQDRHVKVRAGDYADCKDADIVVITVGRKPPANSNRMAELGFTVGLVGEVVDNVLASGFDGVASWLTTKTASPPYPPPKSRKRPVPAATKSWRPRAAPTSALLPPWPA